MIKKLENCYCLRFRTLCIVWNQNPNLGTFRGGPLLAFISSGWGVLHVAVNCLSWYLSGLKLRFLHTHSYSTGFMVSLICSSMPVAIFDLPKNWLPLVYYKKNFSKNSHGTILTSHFVWKIIIWMLVENLKEISHP